jgi:hypothetical protein
MKFTIGLLLTLVGLAIVLYGLGQALLGVTSIYANALNSPLNDPAAGASTGEIAISKDMMRHVWIGAIGIPPLLVGTVLLKWALYSRWRARRNSAPAQRTLAGTHDPEHRPRA